MRRRKHFIGVVLIALLSAACNAATPSESDQIATDVARAKAVAATLTAAAPTPTATALPPTPKPTLVAPNPPAPTGTPVLQAADPFVPAFTPTAANTSVPQVADEFVPGVGDPRGLKGGILLPGYSGPLDAPVFSDWVNIQLKVFDPDRGQLDGAGIKAVDFTITDPNGNTVVDQQESSAAFCAFANPADDPKCSVWIFSDHKDQWPTGEPVCQGKDYQAQMIVRALNPDRDKALWQFNFAIDGHYPPCQ